MTLYEINDAIENCIDMETGEVDAERLMELEMQKQQKIENVSLWILNLESDAASLAAEEERLAKRREQVEKKIDSLKGWLRFACADENFKGDKCSVVFKKTKYVPDLTDEQIKNLPAEFVVEKVIPEQHILRADKNAIKNAVKDGWVINGVSVEERVKVEIK